jgi:hypothetical protein
VTFPGNSLFQIFFCAADALQGPQVIMGVNRLGFGSRPE